MITKKMPGIAKSSVLPALLSFFAFLCLFFAIMAAGAARGWFREEAAGCLIGVSVFISSVFAAVLTARSCSTSSALLTALLKVLLITAAAYMIKGKDSFGSLFLLYLLCAVVPGLMLSLLCKQKSKKRYSHKR